MPCVKFIKLSTVISEIAIVPLFSQILLDFIQCIDRILQSCVEGLLRAVRFLLYRIPHFLHRFVLASRKVGYRVGLQKKKITQKTTFLGDFTWRARVDSNKSNYHTSLFSVDFFMDSCGFFLAFISFSRIAYARSGSKVGCKVGYFCPPGAYSDSVS